MEDRNDVTLIGRLGKDPEMRFTANVLAVVNFTVATSSKRTKDGKEEGIVWLRSGSLPSGSERSCRRGSA
jgi:single-stranded DNA-binding protein